MVNIKEFIKKRVLKETWKQTYESAIPVVITCVDDIIAMGRVAVTALKAYC